MNSFEKGSQTAKDGFKNEEDVVDKFNNWQKDEIAQNWLKVMDYRIQDIEFVKAVKLSGHKTDVQVQVTIKLNEVIDIQNLQVKLVSNPKGFNQIDKRWTDRYGELWDIPKNIAHILKRYTGEIKPDILHPKDKRRMFANEFCVEEQQSILIWIEENRLLIVNDLLKGRGKFAAEWMLVVQKINKNANWVLKPMNEVINYFGKGEIQITLRGNFIIGRITMQRKGGDGGRATANMLQFKINPAELFNL